MRNNIISFAAIAALVSLASVSCAEIDNPQATEEKVDIAEDGNFTVNFECFMAEPETKTEFHDKTIWWSVGDEALFAQYAVVGGSSTLKTTRNIALTSSKAVLSLTVSSFNEPDTGTDAAYFSVYPYASYAARTTSGNVIYPRITLPSTQSPSADGFDSNADLLISQYEHNLSKGEDGKYTVRLRYKRMVAIAKMAVRNLPSESAISSIEFSAKKSGKAVALAGSRFYDLVNGTPSNLTSTSCYSDSRISLDYSGQSLSADGSGMTAYFCCYPFEISGGDSFTVAVKTAAGEIFTRNVIIPDGKELILAEGMGTQFSVDMSTAEVTCDWLSLSPYSSGSYVPTIDKTYAAVKGSDVASLKWCTADMTTFNGITDFDAYITENGTNLSDTGITNLNSGKTQILQKSGTIDTEYAFIVKATNNAGKSVILTTTARTDWFKLALVTRSSGGVQIQFTGVGLDPAKCRNYRVVATEGLPASSADYETYYTGTLNPGTNASTIESINAKNGTDSYNLGVTKYYTDKSNQANMVSGTNYTALMKVVNTRGESKFVYASANAK